MNERVVTSRLYCRCGEQLEGDSGDPRVIVVPGSSRQARRWAILLPWTLGYFECSHCGFCVEGYDALALNAAWKNGLL